MKKLILSLLVAASFSASANDIAAAQEAVAHASRMADAAQGSVDSAQSSYGQGTVQGWADTSNRAGAFRAQAMADLNAATQNLTSANAPVASQLTSVSKAMENLNVMGAAQTSKPQPVASQLTSVSKDMATANIAGAIGTGKMVNGTINVAASTLSPSTKVKTDKGIVTAGSLPKNTQVAVAFNSAFSSPVRGGNAHSTSHSHGEHGTGNGANNAANSNSAHGLGGGDHIGGGRSGGGYHY